MKKIFTIVCLNLFLLSACATPATTEAPPTVPTQAQTSGFVIDDSSVLWKEIRDEETGYGLAVPCWWQVKAIPVETEGNISSIAIRNYDDNFFNTYSENGDWIGGTPPEGVVVMSVTVAKTTSELNTEESYMQYTQPGTVEVIASQEKKVGELTYTLVTVKSSTDTTLPALTVFINRLSPETVLIINAYPPQAIVSSDFQMILSSLTLEGETVSIPSNPPEQALVNIVCPY